MYGTQCCDCLSEGIDVSDPENWSTNNGAAIGDVGIFGVEIPVCNRHAYARQKKREN